jgi:bacillopeptidase F
MEASDVTPEAYRMTEGEPTKDGKRTYIVYLKEQADLEPAQLMATRLARRQAVVSALQATAQRTQADILAYLERQRSAGKVTGYTSYWIFNGLAVSGDLETLLALAARPEVEIIRANHKHRLVNWETGKSGNWETGKSGNWETGKSVNRETGLPIYRSTNLPIYQSTKSQVVEWNIAQVRADEVWRDFDVTGRGVVVANLDTGVDWTHPALRDQYRGANGNHGYNWFDFTDTYPNAPADGDGHGTHTMGTILGFDPDSDFYIGMAPDAQWIAVKVFDDDGVGYDAWIHAGFQWLLAPTDVNGRNPDPGKAPDVVNNSWGPFPPNVADLTFLPDVQALRAAGIFPVFSAGNEGELGDGTVGAPAGLPESFAVGATNFDDTVASFSSRGPSFWGEFKPEVCAPGVDIRSSIPGGGYEGGWSGTSMAAPHVAGLAALLLSANRTLTLDELETFMRFTADDFGEVGPDNACGWGRIDAYDAVRWVLGAGKLYGLVNRETGKSVNRETGLPIYRSTDLPIYQSTNLPLYQML